MGRSVVRDDPLQEVRRGVAAPQRCRRPRPITRERTKRAVTLDILTAADVAAICHEANRTYCAAMGDYSQPVWALAPQWQRDSAVNGVRFHLANPDATAAASHESWLREKIADGWRYGPVKDPEAKLHPCMVPFDELPPSQQAKDHLFRAIAHGLAPFVLQETADA